MYVVVKEVADDEVGRLGAEIERLGQDERKMVWARRPLA